MILNQDDTCRIYFQGIKEKICFFYLHASLLITGF